MQVVLSKEEVFFCNWSFAKVFHNAAPLRRAALWNTLTWYSLAETQEKYIYQVNMSASNNNVNLKPVSKAAIIEYLLEKFFMWSCVTHVIPLCFLSLCHAEETHLSLVNYRWNVDVCWWRLNQGSLCVCVFLIKRKQEEVTIIPQARFLVGVIILLCNAFLSRTQRCSLQ